MTDVAAGPAGPDASRILRDLKALSAIGGAAAGGVDRPAFSLAYSEAVAPAMPLFVLAGLLMNDTGISTRLLAFARVLIGHLRGGLAMVNVLASMLFGGISGSSVADTAALGSVLIPGMSKQGYSREVSAAITSSSGSIGIIIPPSIPMILYGAITSVSVGTLFIAGLIPGLLIGLSQIMVIAVLARRHSWGAVETFSWRRLGRAMVEGVPALVMPVIIIGGIISGVFTPTEAGAVAVVYGVVVSVVFYRSLTLAAIYRSLVNAGVLSAVLIALGAILHGDPLMLIMVPILYPAVIAVGGDPLHLGIVVVLCVAIGQQTPPVGSTLFVVSAIAQRNIFAVSAANLPFVLTLVAALGLVILIPDLVFWLPEAVGLR